jgi:hypothetical protein
VDARQFHLHDGKKGSALAVRVTPRSSRDEIAAILNDGTVKVHLTVAGDDMEINQALVNFLTKTLDVPRGRVDIVAGVSGKDKLVSILDLDTAEVQERILRKMN